MEPKLQAPRFWQGFERALDLVLASKRHGEIHPTSDIPVACREKFREVQDALVRLKGHEADQALREMEE